MIIRDLGLTKVENSKVGTAIVRGISGGEKRRAYLGTQMITMPRILFFDEPTSGLDSASSYLIIKNIKKLAKKYNIVVIMTIH